MIRKNKWDRYKNTHPLSEHGNYAAVKCMLTRLSVSYWEEFFSWVLNLHAHIFMHLYKHTFIFRHMCTVHTTHTSYVWLIQRRIRSLTVTNSCWQPNTKKAHTLTPNLWGGLGIREGSDLAAGRHSCLHHTTYSLLLLPLLTPPPPLRPLWPVFKLSFFFYFVPFFRSFLLLYPPRHLCKVFRPYFLSLSFAESDRFPLSSFILEAEETAVWCDPSRRAMGGCGVPDHRLYQSHS